MDLGEPEGIRIAIFERKQCQWISGPEPRMLMRRTGQREHFVANVYGSIMLSLIECLLPPTTEVFLHYKRVV